MRTLGMITVRQLVYAVLALFIGVLGGFWLSSTGLPGTGLVFLLIGFAGPFLIITFRQLDALLRVRKIYAWTCVATVFAAYAAGILFSVGYPVATKVNGEGILLIDNDTLSLVRAPSTGRLLSVLAKQGDRSRAGGRGRPDLPGSTR